MDLVLLGFCLISLLITGFIVFLDISRRGTRKLDVPQENLPEFDESLPLKGMEVGETPELSDAEEDWKVESISSRDEPVEICLLYTSPSPRDRQKSRMPSSA